MLGHEIEICHFESLLMITSRLTIHFLVFRHNLLALLVANRKVRPSLTLIIGPIGSI